MSAFPRPDYRALTRYAPDRRPVDLDLSDNTNLWGTHPAALARIRDADVDVLARYPDLYADALRQAVGERFGVGHLATLRPARPDVSPGSRKAVPGGRIEARAENGR